jgi:hypothetical protein
VAFALLDELLTKIEIQSDGLFKPKHAPQTKNVTKTKDPVKIKIE